MFKLTTTIFSLFAAATVVSAVAIVPSNVPSSAEPATREMHQIRTIALEKIGNATIAPRDTYGEGTWYDISGGYTACGGQYSGDAWVVAIAADVFDNYPGYNGNPSDNPICNQQIWLWGSSGNSPTSVAIVDRCQGCSAGGVDMTEAVFAYVVGDVAIGEAAIGWNWV